MYDLSEINLYRWAQWALGLILIDRLVGSGIDSHRWTKWVLGLILIDRLVGYYLNHMSIADKTN